MEELNQKNPFKAPEGYFEGFPDRLRDRLSKEGTGLSEPDSFPGSGFVVPEGYFEGLGDSIWLKLEGQETKVVPLHPPRKYYYAVASIAAIALTIFVLNRNTSKEINFDDIANSEIEAYFENNELDFSTYEMAEIMPVDELEISDILSDRLDDDTILEYVDNNTNNYEDLNLDDEQPN
jgi:hypothetical protein